MIVLSIVGGVLGLLAILIVFAIVIGRLFEGE